MKDLQVYDLKNYLSTRSPIRFNCKDTGESFIAKIGSFDIYANMYITKIFCSNNELNLDVQSEI